MPFDAQSLWWPPLRKLQTLLVNTPDHVGLAVVSELLAEYEPVLSKGINFFAKPNASSKQALERETTFAIGTKKLPVDPAMRAPAIELSRMLDLNEIQSYLLLRRWVQETNELLAREALSPQQRSNLQATYFTERRTLLNCLDNLLQSNAVAAEDDEFAAYTRKLLTAGLDAVILDALVGAYRQQPLLGGVLEPTDQQAIVALTELEGLTAKAEQAKMERMALVDLAILLYGQQGCKGTLQRGLELLRVMRPLIVFGPNTMPGTASEQHPDHLALILLIAVLDLNKLMTLVHSGQKLDPESHKLGSFEARVAVDKELRSWGAPSNPIEGEVRMHAPLLLCWATFICLSNSIASPSEEEISWGDHADWAWNGAALQGLVEVLRKGTLSHSSTRTNRLYRRVLQGLLLAVLACFELTPSTLPGPTLDCVLDIITGIYKGNERLCQQFWDRQGLVIPLSRFMGDAEQLFPAVPGPLLRMLAALSSGPKSASAATQYLHEVDKVAWIHSAGETGIRHLSGREGMVEAVEPLQLQDLNLTVPKGAQGRVTPLPVLARHGNGRGRETIESVILVVWSMHPPSGLHLIIRGLNTRIASIQQAMNGASKAAVDAAVAEAGNALQVLSSLTAISPVLFLETGDLEDKPLLSAPASALLARTVNVLCMLPHPPLDVIGNCCKVMTSLARTLGVQVAEDLSSTVLFQPDCPSMGPFFKSASSVADCRLLNLSRMNSECEGRMGHYPITLSVLDMAASLMDAGLLHQLLLDLVGFTLSHVLAKHHMWQYSQKAERWQLSGAAVRVLRSALSQEPVRSKGPDFAAKLRATMGQQGAGAVYLFRALPPSAAKLEALENAGNYSEVKRAEACVLEWLRLLPCLLSEGSPEAPQLAHAFFEVSDGLSVAPASVIASYLGYESFSVSERGLVIQALAALSQASGELQHVCFSTCLLKEGCSRVDNAVRDSLLEPLLYPTEVPAHAFRACCQLLLSAIDFHPSLQDILLFPTLLLGQTEHPAKDDSAAGKGNQLSLPVQRQPVQGGAKGPSALDGLWKIVQKGRDLSESHPSILAMAMHGLLGLWQGGSMTFKAVQLLKNQPGFWTALANCLPESQQKKLVLGDVGADVSWISQTEAAWRFDGESCVLQLFSLEGYRWPRSSSGQEGCWAVLDAWESEEGGGRQLALLQRYSGPCSASSLLDQLSRDAEIAAVHLLHCLLSGLHEDAAGSLGLPGSPYCHLYNAARPLLACFGNMREAITGLGLLVQDMLQPSATVAGPLQQHLRNVLKEQDLGGVLLKIFHSSQQRIHGIPLYGNEYMYKPRLLTRLTGAYLDAGMESLQRLYSDLRDVSCMASAESAKLSALHSLRALYTVTSPKASTSDLATPVHALESTLRPLLTKSDFAEASTSGSFSSDDACLALAAEIAEIVLAHLHSSRHKGGKLGASLPAVISLRQQTLQITRDWLSRSRSHESLENGRLIDSPLSQSLTSSLLAACLIALQSATTLYDMTHFEASVGVQEALLQLLPLLCEMSHEQSQQASVSLAILLASLQLLVPSDWLPVLQRCLDVDALLQWSFQQVADVPDGGAEGESEQPQRQEAQAVASGALQLVLAVALDADGSAWLNSTQLFSTLQMIGRWLLSPHGGGLGHVQGAERRTDGHSCAQQQWTTLMSLHGVLLRSLRGRQIAGQAAVTFAVSAQERMIAALIPPDDTSPYKLSLADVQEADRTLFFLCGMDSMMGQWQMALLRAPRQARQAAVEWITLAAGPSNDPDFSISCQPVTQAERILAQQASEFSAAEGWFSVFAAGAGNMGEVAYGRTQQMEYSVQMAEAMYSSAAQALVLLNAFAPELDDEEIRALGSEWPSPHVLAGLQAQCIAVGYEVCDQTTPAKPRSKKLCKNLLCLLMASRALQELLRYNSDMAHISQIQEVCSKLKRVLVQP